MRMHGPVAPVAFAFMLVAAACGSDEIASDGAPAIDAAEAPDADTRPAAGWNLVAIDTPDRTYLDYVLVPAARTWTPEADGWPTLAAWEGVTTYSALRFQPFTPGEPLAPERITALLPALAVAARTIDITAAPYGAEPEPADATDAIQRALDDAGAMASRGEPVDVLVPAGTYRYADVLDIPADVRLRRFPADTGGELVATDPANQAIHLAGDRSAALFLVVSSPSSTVRLTTPQASGIWVGPATASGTPVYDAVVVGNEVISPAAAHVVGLAAHRGLWAFNDVRDGFADSYHHTGRSSYAQVVGNRTRTSQTRGDDFYAFVGYAGDGDPVHHCAVIANHGREGHARGLAAVGAGFIAFEHNDVGRTQWAGVYLAQEDSYSTFGTFDITVVGNNVVEANQGGSHDGLLAYASSPADTDPSITFGDIVHRVSRISIRDNTIASTAPGIGNGFGVELRASVDGGDVTGNTLTANRDPQLVIDGTNITESGNTITP
jgi:hypothetical protein